MTSARGERSTLVATPLGVLRLSAQAGVLTGVGLAGTVCADEATAHSEPQDPVLARAAAQVRAWFGGALEAFDLPLADLGTPFQRRVWSALRRIPRGQTRRYGELAQALGSAPRAVGGACRANPWLVVVPCHRAVSASGLGGFMGAQGGAALDLKAALLAHEAHVA